MRMIVSPNIRKSYIHPEVYGNFSEHLGRCIYEGVYVGENSEIPNVNGMRSDVVEALKKIKLPVLRWPGGCFADEYHWRDGVGDKSARKRMVNTHWGGVVEDNSFGTHEFFELCRQIGCEPYINGNLGSGSVQEMQEWVEYMTGDGISPMADMRRKNGKDEPWKLKYFAVGNENWGCGGNMTPQFYSDNYRRYQTYVRNYGDNRIYKIACGPGAGYRGPNYEWTETLMREAGRHMNGLSLHYYTLPNDSWSEKGSATVFDEKAYYDTLAKADYMDELCTGHAAIMDRYDPEKKIGLIVDEWGAWYDVEPGTNPGFLYQQSTMRDALIAAITLNIFNKHSDRVHMANIAQLINVLQAVILTDGSDMLLTPTYHVFDMFKAHQGGTLVESIIGNEYIKAAGREMGLISQSASVDKDGNICVTIANASATDEKSISLRIDEANVKVASAEILTGGICDHNTFDNKQNVCPKAFDGVKCRASDGGTECELTLPAVSVLTLVFKAQ